MKRLAEELMELNGPTPEVRRDRWGRYLVVPPDGGKPRGYTRATTIAKTLDDTSNLERWSVRMVALGLARRPDLLAQVATLPDDDRKALNDLCDKAKEAGGATIRRDLGTAMHSMFERTCTDADYRPPAPYDADMDAIHRALTVNGLRLVGLHERIVVNDTHEIAGTFDLLVERLADGKLIVGDFKTGSDVKYGAIGYSVQLAIYATADALYTQGAAADGSQDVREPMPDVDRTVGLLIHCEPGSGRCDLYWIDLITGRAALELAMKVRTARKVDPLVPIYPEPREAFQQVNQQFPGTVDVTAYVTGYVDDAWRDWMRGRIERLADAALLDTLACAWPSQLPTLGSDQKITTIEGEDIAKVVSKVERDGGLPFPAPQPGADSAISRGSFASYVPPDEGGVVSVDEIQATLQRASSLDEHAAAWLSAMLAACHNSGRDVRLTNTGAQPSQRRLAICEALVTFAPHQDDELLRTLVGIATGDEVRTAVSLGRAVGSLSIEEAKRLQKLVRAIDDLTLRVGYSDDGAVVILGDTDAIAA